MRRVQTVEIPRESRIRSALPRIDYADAYQVALPDTLLVDIEQLPRQVLTATPAWARYLMQLLGPLSAGAKDASQRLHRAGESQGPLQVFERTDDEVIVGGNNRHLDFRISFLCPQHQAPHLLTMITVVRCHNQIGRLYFALIAPLHCMIAPAMLGQFAQQGQGAVRR